ncbi:MAG: transposase [Deltaproteobacteria bacterium]|nr:transposase [Deltaproteobacteria bacterium]
MKRKWDARTKARIVLEGLMGGNVNEICRVHDLRPGLYYKWRGYFLDHCHSVFEEQPRPPTQSDLVLENEKLKRLVGELTLELNKNIR